MKYLTRCIVILSFLCVTLQSKAQQCTIQFKGLIKDQSTGIPLPYSNVLLKDQGRGVVTDSLGNFVLDGLCAGDYHLEFSHLGCEEKQLFLVLTKDT
ncbi:MAG: carboxypeptidase-like regulatory domain-containing protein, partial [Bacteroidota bacterium]